MYIFNLPPKPPLASHCLPLTLISLDEWILVSVTGPDSDTYLQGQLTLDITSLKSTDHRLTAHCNEKGKMWSNLRIFHYRGYFAYFVRRALCSAQMKELKKYAVFSKVKIKEENELVLLGVAGFKAREALESTFYLPDANTPVIKDKDTTLLWFNEPTERFFLITTSARLCKIQKDLEYNARLSDSQQWVSLDIESGIPVIDPATSAQFIPQATGLQLLDAISFEKGCYIGQEVVTRSTLRGINKRTLYWLTGHAGTLPKVGSSIEQLIGEKWRATGVVLASVKVNADETWLQVVMGMDLSSENVFRVPGEEASVLKIRRG